MPHGLREMGQGKSHMAGSNRILVTGAAGFIGGACAREFLARGCETTLLIHRSRPEGLDGAEVVQGSLLDMPFLKRLLEERGPFDAIVNCAGLASDVASPARLMDANCHSVKNLVTCLRGESSNGADLEIGGPGTGTRLVHISTTDVYGIRDFVAADENTPLQDNRRNGYARSKILAERAIVAGLPAGQYAILRPGAVCGPGDKTLLPRVLGFLRGSRYVVHFGRWRGKNRWPLAHVGNLAKAAFLAATCPDAAGQAYNVVDPPTVTVEEYSRWALKTFLPHKADIPSITIPLPLAWPYACAATLISRLLGRDHPPFEPSLYALYSIAANLDFSSRKLEELFARHGEKLQGSLQK